MNSILSERLKKSREEKKLTQQQLSDIIAEEYDGNISRTSIARYETGGREPDSHTLTLLSLALNVDVDYLLGKKETKHQEAINEQIRDFMGYLNDIISNDNEVINDTVYKILDDVRSFIGLGLANNTLEQIAHFIYLLQLALSSYYSHPLEKSLTQLEDQLKKTFELSRKMIFKDSIENMVQFVNKYGLESIDESMELILCGYYGSYMDDEDIPVCIKPLIKKYKESKRK